MRHCYDAQDVINAHISISIKIYTKETSNLLEICCSGTHASTNLTNTSTRPTNCFPRCIFFHQAHPPTPPRIVGTASNQKNRAWNGNMFAMTTRFPDHFHFFTWHATNYSSDVAIEKIGTTQTSATHSRHTDRPYMHVSCNRSCDPTYTNVNRNSNLFLIIVAFTRPPNQLRFVINVRSPPTHPFTHRCQIRQRWRS